MRDDMAELIRYAKDRGIRHVSLNTNGHLLTAERAEALVASGIDHVEFSIDASSPETYLAIRRSPDHQHVVENVLRFTELCRRARRGARVSVSFILQPKNRHELKAFRQVWSPRVDLVSVRAYHQHGGLVDGAANTACKALPRRYPCPFLWKRTIIHLDG